jgi:3-deoxy-D-manno-octulosonate 8-phosphate phosphatase (KDO 8-P phosphatase)
LKFGDEVALVFENQNSKLATDELETRAKAIRLLLMDCDGVMTDGRLWWTADGDEQKAFHVRDGLGIALCHRAGLRTGIISGRESSATRRRATELGMAYLRQNVRDKLTAFNEILRQARLSANECAYVGDDLVDLPIMRRAGLAIAVADAIEEAKAAAHYVTRHKGGCGAVREAVDLILRVQGLRDD